MRRFVEESSSRINIPAGGKAATAFAVYEGSRQLFNQGRDLWYRHMAYSVSVSEKDPLYADVMAWLMSVTRSERHRNLLVSSAHSRSYEVGPFDSTSDPQAEKPKPLNVRFDASMQRKIRIDGHDITVRLYTPEFNEAQLMTREPPAAKIHFTAMTHSGQKAVVTALERINAAKKSERMALLRMVGQWGSWKVRSDIPPRTLESVAMPEVQKNRIVDDLGFFLEAEDRYNRLAIPYHRGYMFHGPPGTGKTSIVKALACHFNLDLWYVSLSDLKAESSLLGLLAEVGPRSILLLEDIDTVKITQERDSAEQGTISMSSLLNTLDGVGTPHGLVTMMTTNRFDVLDEALTRTGRMDLVEELSWPTGETLTRMFKHFFGVYPSWPSDVVTDKPIEDVSPAQVAEIFKQNLDDPEQASANALDLIVSHQ